MSRHIRKYRRRSRHRRLSDGQRAMLARRAEATAKWLANLGNWQW